ncbi:MAG: cytochrome c biosis protein CcmG, thiol:disulfide interchange protein DsbE [Sphingomonadales bacterium]|jgi:cytochrome c biogenesis protein CcmG/thiol:disulfide interchange protein DsbE|nr:cytochrome c biosis protein CcmG, thiol:disulfide interchange protein DsbE [Sphingomonadales bacterium]
MRRAILWAPLAVFVLLVGLVVWGLRRPDDTTIHSQMIGKPMPDFALQPAVASHPGLSLADLRSGKPHLVNVFASWCVPCRAEAAQLAALTQRGVPIVGIAIRDKPGDVARFLDEVGDPFERIGSDPRSQVQFDLGSSGVPETFIVDGRGVVRLQHIGDIRTEDMPAIFAAYEAAK